VVCCMPRRDRDRVGVDEALNRSSIGVIDGEREF